MRALIEHSKFYTSIGKFDIYGDQWDDEFDPTNGEYSVCALKVTCRGNDLADRAALHERMCAIQMQLYNSVDCFVTEVECKTGHNKHLNGITTEMALEFSLNEDDKLLTWDKVVQLLQSESEKLQVATLNGELLPDFTNAKITFSCAFAEGPYKYVKVRFAKYSIKYFFNKNGFDAKKTKKEIKEDHDYSDALINKIMEVLERPGMLEKATGKPVNTSGIGISTPIRMFIVKPIKNGWAFSTLKDVSDPSIKPAFVLHEDNHQFLVDSNNKIFSIEKFTYTGVDAQYYNQQDNTYLPSDPVEYKMKLLSKHVISTTVDDFTKQRIERAIKRKL